MTRLPALQTDRLTLRPLTRADVTALFPLFADPETMRFMPTPPHRAPMETEAAVGGELDAGARYWSMRLTPDGPPLGYTGFLAHTRIPGMGYILHRDYWGRGIVVEAATAVLDYAFEGLGLPQVELWIDERNVRSRRVAEKLHFRLRGQIPQKYRHNSDHHLMLIYGCWADEWTASRKEGDTALPIPPPTPRIFRQEPVLLVPDLPQTVQFYTDRLGFSVTFLFGDPAEHAGLALGHWSNQGAQLQLSQGDPQQPFAFNGWFYIFVDARLDELYAQIAANDVTVLRPPRDYPWGMREFTIADNNGLQLRFGTQR